MIYIFFEQGHTSEQILQALNKENFSIAKNVLASSIFLKNTCRRVIKNENYSHILFIFPDEEDCVQPYQTSRSSMDCIQPCEYSQLRSDNVNVIPEVHENRLLSESF